MTTEGEAAWLRLERRFRIVAWAIGGLMLLTPLVAMQFTSEVNWTGSDFIFAAVLIGRRCQAGTYVNLITSLPIRSLATNRSGGRGRAKKGLPPPRTMGWV